MGAKIYCENCLNTTEHLFDSTEIECQDCGTISWINERGEL